MNTIVIDASVALAWCFPDEASGYADRVLELMEDQTVLVPPIWPIEVANGLRVGALRKRITPVEVSRFLELISELAIDCDTQTPMDQLRNGFELAVECGLSAYDASYLNVAVRHEIPIATLDAELQRAARKARITLFDA